VSKVILGVVLGLALGAAGALTFVKYPAVADFLGLSETSKEEEPQTGTEAEASFIQHDAQGQTVIKLEPNEQSLIGLKVAPLAAAQSPAEVRGFGRVLDPTPLAALVTEGTAAQAALQASTKEYERVKTLFAQDQNASARALETAEAAMNKDRVALESARWRLLAGWGKEIVAQPDLPAFVASLAARQAVLMRVDVPLGEQLQAPPAAVRVAAVGMPEDMIEAQVLGPAPTTDPQVQTEGYLLLAKTEALTPGAALRAWLAVPGPARSGVIIPREAVLRHEGKTFVYLQTLDDAFQRRAVTLERPLGNGWFTDQDFKPQDKVVVVGAQQLLSEELKGQGGEEE
jgi:hypothetical protein